MGRKESNKTKHTKGLVLHDLCFGKNLDFSRNYERMSGIFVPCINSESFDFS